MRKRNAAGQFAAGRRVVASSRPPDIVRFGFSALYHPETDVRELVRSLNNALSATRRLRAAL